MIAELEEQELEEESVQEAKIQNIEDASKYLRKIKYLKGKIQENDALAQTEMARITEWQRKENEGITNTIGYFETILQEYFREQRAANPKYKLSTPYGKVRSRKQQDKWEYDEEVVLKALKDNDMAEFIRTKEEINKAELKKRVADKEGLVIDAITGAVIDGIKITPQPDKIEVITE